MTNLVKKNVCSLSFPWQKIEVLMGDSQCSFRNALMTMGALINAVFISLSPRMTTMRKGPLLENWACRMTVKKIHFCCWITEILDLFVAAAFADWYTNCFLQLAIVILEHIKLNFFDCFKKWRKGGDKKGREIKGKRNAFMLLLLLLTLSCFHFPSSYYKCWALKCNSIESVTGIEGVCFWIQKINMETSH